MIVVYIWLSFLCRQECFRAKYKQDWWNYKFFAFGALGFYVLSVIEVAIFGVRVIKDWPA